MVLIIEYTCKFDLNKLIGHFTRSIEIKQGRESDLDEK